MKSHLSFLAKLGGVTALGFVLVFPAQAQWKWRDASGRVQYSDAPPPANVSPPQILKRPAGDMGRAAAPMGSASTAALTAANASAAASQENSKRVEPELEAKRRKAELEEVEKKKQEQAKIDVAKSDNCARARNYLRTLQDGIRIAQVNSKGEREILDDKTRGKEASRAQTTISSDCK
jgi:hypothetical protein